ncbi:MAG: acetyl-CoA carboxylase biotin carboxylase subunit [Saprospiraceae bacterium]|nr:acetyl-CoA carboxylase biotin carboxylase subunit [Saprospiraceae bacterium]
MQKILVANRGEIAVRVIQSVRRMGLRSVAVYSDVDRSAPHVLLADESVCLGDPAPAASYLNIEKILAAARTTGADAIHPGYGFLSENANFARAVAEAGLTFIGPPPEAIEIMGSKLAAKDAVRGYDIPMVPGTDTALTDPEEALDIARNLGFPVLVKASAGGGGKGMRIVNQPGEFTAQLERARSEAMNAFGDDAVFVEKYIGSPRHIEVQILADQHGHCVHLFERECSVQRRHQKVVEEAPSPVVHAAMRQAIGAAAVRVAQACGYTGAGTVEFIVDEALNFYFLEMNTRLQVEHPVTELTTGIDLVEQQIRVARGEPLAFGQEDLSQRGHAIELRIYAEDPFDDFLPSIGTLIRFQVPEGPDIRVDNGYREGMEVPLHYDPLLAKLIVFGADRSDAISRMIEAIDQFHVQGVQTTLPFGRFVMCSKPFRSGQFDTHFVRDHFTVGALRPDDHEARVAAQIAAMLQHQHEKTVKLHRHVSPGWMARGRGDG